MQYTDFFSKAKIHLNKTDVYRIFAQKIDCGYTLESPRRGGSNEYLQSMFWIKIKENKDTPVNPVFTIYKWG